MLFCANDDTISISWRVERGAPGIKISDMKVAETHDAEHSMMDQRFHDCNTWSVLSISDEDIKL